MDSGASEDKELVRRYLAGDSSAGDSLVRNHASRLYQTAYALTSSHQDAEEVVQDAFIRGFKALPKFRGEAGFGTWMHRIVVNLSRNKFHWNKLRGSDVNVSISEHRETLDSERGTEEDRGLPDENLSPVRMLENVELETTVLKGFEELPETLKEAMVLRHVHEYSYERIAEVLNCKVGTVKSRLARGREVLRGMMDNYL